MRPSHLLQVSWLCIGHLSLVPLTHGFLRPKRAALYGRSKLARPSSSSSIALELLGVDNALALPADLLSYEIQGTAKQLLVACVFNEVGADGLNREALDGPNTQLNELLTTCLSKAPDLVSVEGGLLYLARLAAWVPRDMWVRPLDEWTAPDPETTATPEDHAAHLAAHLVEKWSDLGGAEVPLRLALTYVDGPFGCSESAQKVSCAFLKTYAAAATGSSNVRAALQAHAVPDLSKRASKLFAAPAAKKLPAPDDSANSENSLSGSNNNDNNTTTSTSTTSSSSSSTSAISARGNPLKALREAQVYALFGDALDGPAKSKDNKEEEGVADDAFWVSDAAWNAKPLQRLSAGDREDFLQQALLWVVTHRTELAEPSRVTACLNFFDEMRSIEGPSYSPAGRTPKSVLAALEAYELSTIQFDEEDEEFQPNPCNIAGFFKQQATIPAGTEVYVPYDGVHQLGGPPRTILGKEVEPPQPGHGPVTVRMQEISSLRRLIFEGEQLGNCLRDRYSSQVKYVSRARQRASSYWSLTLQRERSPEEAAAAAAKSNGSNAATSTLGPVEYMCLVEIWHLRRGNVVHQAEGPRPRTIPSPEAWYWLDQWCKQENLDLTEWECYS